MSKLKNAPTLEFYEVLQDVYNTFNHALFDGKLDNSLITLQRKANTFGYISFNRFASTQSNQVYIHELALNPDFFGIKPLIEIMQTLVHEQCHLWQFLHGTPSQKSYHNFEWSAKMQEIGLMPSDTGRVGGKKIGQHMGEYPIKDGKFLAVCNELFSRGVIVEWYDRYLPKNTSVERMIRDKDFTESVASGAAMELLTVPHLEAMPTQTLKPSPQTVIRIEDDAPTTARILGIEKIKPDTSKQKFTCGCGTNLWGKKTLDVTCKKCGSDFVMQ